jgi:hypothetical protein
MARIARKVAQVEQDLGSANQVIGEQIQEHFTRRKPAPTASARSMDRSPACRPMAGFSGTRARDDQQHHHRVA